MRDSCVPISRLPRPRSNPLQRFDQGPSLLLLPKLFQETFLDLDTSLEKEGVQLLKCTPNYTLHFRDGATFSLSTDTAVMKREIERYEGVDGFERYLAWLSEAHAHYEISVSQVLHRNFTSIFNLLRWDFLKELLRLHPFESIYSRASKYFHTERLRRVFTFGSMYMGMSPFDAPGTYSLLQYTELAEGIWYPVGGFHRVVEALVGVGERLGVKYRLNCPVTSVITSKDGKRATGVLLDSGETLTADVVVINADLVYAYNNLFSFANTPITKSNVPYKPRSDFPVSSYARSLTTRAGSCSSISFYWSLSRTIPELSTHNIFLADSYKDSFDAIFARQSIPEDPSFYVNVPSRVDSTAAPEGCDAVVVLVPVGHLLKSRTSIAASTSVQPSSSSKDEDTGTGKGLEIDKEQDWDSIVSSARTQIISTIEARTGCAAIAPLIEHELLNTPNSWEETFNLDKGSILGLSHSFFNVLAFRPGIKHQGEGLGSTLGGGLGGGVKGFLGGGSNGLENVYFVGASTHPGTGVPIVLAGAKMTSEVILNDLKLEIPWGSWDDGLGKSVESQDKRTKAIDRIQRPQEVSMYVLGGFTAMLVLLVGLWWQNQIGMERREQMQA